MKKENKTNWKCISTKIWQEIDVTHQEVHILSNNENKAIAQNESFDLPVKNALNEWLLLRNLSDSCLEESAGSPQEDIII